MSPIDVVFIIIAIFFVLFGLVVFIGAPYVPSHAKDIKRAFKHFSIGSKDVLVDVGSGDGIVLRAASRIGATAVGYEINVLLVMISRILSMGDARVSVHLQNLWKAKLPAATTIVYAFAVRRDEKRLIRFMQHEADRLQRPLKLLCYASPFRHREAVETFEAYHLYIFRPLQPKNA